MRKSTAERLWPKVDIREPDECWPWLGATRLANEGKVRVGTMRMGNTKVEAHRIAWQLERGEIPAGFVVTRECGNRMCCNVAHMSCHKSHPAIVVKLLRLSERSGDHLLWKGTINRSGYGSIRVNQATKQVHRVAYEAWVGPIPEGLEIDHLCYVPNCIEPTHLEPVTGEENRRRARERAAAARATAEESAA